MKNNERWILASTCALLLAACGGGTVGSSGETIASNVTIVPEEPAPPGPASPSGSTSPDATPGTSTASTGGTSTPPLPPGPPVTPTPSPSTPSTSTTSTGTTPTSTSPTTPATPTPTTPTTSTSTTSTTTVATVGNEAVADPNAVVATTAWQGGTVSRFSVQAGAFGTGSGLSVAMVDAQDGSTTLLRRYSSSDASVWNAAALPSGRFLYGCVTRPQDQQGRLTVFSVDPGTGEIAVPGALALGSTSTLRACDGTPVQFATSESYVHVLNRNSGQVWAMAVGGNGRLADVPGSPFATGTTVYGEKLVAHASGKLVFLGRPDAPVRVFRVEANGALTEVPRVPSAPAEEAGDIVPAGPDRAWVHRKDDTWLLYSVDTTTGRLQPATAPYMITATSTTVHPGDPDPRLYADPTGKVLLVLRVASSSGGAQPRMQAYAYDEALNTLTRIGNALFPFNPSSVDVHADPNAAAFFRQAHVTMRVDPGAGLQFASATALDAPVALVAASSPLTPVHYTYGIDTQRGLLQAFSVNDASGALVQVSGGSQHLLGRPVAIAASSPADTLAVVSDNGVLAGSLAVLRIDPATGLPALVASAATGAGPTSVSASLGTPTKFHVAHAAGIDEFLLSGTTLQRVPGSPFPAAWGAIPTGFNMTTGNWQTTGTAQPLALQVSGLAALREGNLFAAVSSANPDPAIWGTTQRGLVNSGISTLVESANDQLAPEHAGGYACAVGIYPTGPTVFATGNGPTAMASVAGGRVVFASNPDSNWISGFFPGQAWCGGGSWMPEVPGSPFATGTRPVAITADPRSRYLFVALGAASIAVYAVDPFSGKLTAITGSPFASDKAAASLWTDALGHFLYAADATGAVRVMAIDRASGKLSAPLLASPRFSVHTALDAVVGLR